MLDIELRQSRNYISEKSCKNCLTVPQTQVWGPKIFPKAQIQGSFCGVQAWCRTGTGTLRVLHRRRRLREVQAWCRTGIGTVRVLVCVDVSSTAPCPGQQAPLLPCRPGWLVHLNGPDRLRERGRSNVSLFV